MLIVANIKQIVDNFFGLELAANPLRLCVVSASRVRDHQHTQANFRGSFLFHVSKIAMTDYLCGAKYPNELKGP